MKLRINAQTQSREKSKTIYYRIFTYFAAFSVVILIILWLLQIFFLQTFYQWMKSGELYSLADVIEESVGTESLYDTITHLTVKSDMYIEIERGDSGVIYGTAQSLPSERMAQFAQRYNTSALKAKLLTDDVDHVVTKQTISPGNTETMIYASILGTDSETGELIYLFIFSPLTPVGTTISILAKMLVVVTILSIFIGLVMSIVISRRLAQPLYSITDSAAQLAKGHYDIKFEGTGYAETEELADTLNYAAAELSKSDKLQKDLVANVSHDLKTPLTMVKSYAEMIRDLSGDNPEKRNRHLQVIINEADRLNLLVNDLTSLSKMRQAWTVCTLPGQISGRSHPMSSKAFLFMRNRTASASIWNVREILLSQRTKKRFTRSFPISSATRSAIPQKTVRSRCVSRNKKMRSAAKSSTGDRASPKKI